MLRHLEELGLRERAASERLARFRGDMCDVDFATLVKEVVRLRDKVEGRVPMYPWDRPSVNLPTQPALVPIIQKWLDAQSKTTT
jgi:hypothetical protein